MANDQRNIKFGYFLIPTVDAPLLSIAQEVERLGLDYIAVQDHPYQRRFVDTWTLLSMIAAKTSRIGLLPDVTNLPLRPPAVMAKAAATIDVLSGGRFELGLGAGAFWDAIEAYGGPRRSTGVAFEAMAEAIEVIRMVWSGDRNLRFEGQHYQLKGAQSGPVPAHPIGIWLGVTGPRSLKLAGKVADGWLPSLRGDLSALAEKSKRLDDAVAEAGRDPASIRRVINVNGVITDGASNGLLQGPVNQWVDELTNLVSAYRFDTFIFWGEGGNQLQRFAEEVAPAVRERVAAK
ncbi:MAG: LLM class flavin-dependent oxidoreductase [Anaerolineales bacterium]|nr:MAG: LLM class flavin-dependent oxidoreductase [Anaerolineales bacterium]